MLGDDLSEWFCPKCKCPNSGYSSSCFDCGYGIQRNPRQSLVAHHHGETNLTKKKANKKARKKK